MKFREAMDELKAKYGNTAALSLTTSTREDGSECDTVFAHGHGFIGFGGTYEEAMAALAGKCDKWCTPPEDEEAEMAAQDRAEAQYQDAKDRGERI